MDSDSQQQQQNSPITHQQQMEQQQSSPVIHCQDQQNIHLEQQYQDQPDLQQQSQQQDQQNFEYPNPEVRLNPLQEYILNLEKFKQDMMDEVSYMQGYIDEEIMQITAKIQMNTDNIENIGAVDNEHIKIELMPNGNFAIYNYKRKNINFLRYEKEYNNLEQLQHIRISIPNEERQPHYPIIIMPTVNDFLLILNGIRTVLTMLTLSIC